MLACAFIDLKQTNPSILIFAFTVGGRSQHYEDLILYVKREALTLQKLLSERVKEPCTCS